MKLFLAAKKRSNLIKKCLAQHVTPQVAKTAKTKLASTAVEAAESHVEMAL
jgi:hypothetical protein